MDLSDLHSELPPDEALPDVDKWDVDPCDRCGCVIEGPGTWIGVDPSKGDDEFAQLVCSNCARIKNKYSGD